MKLGQGRYALMGHQGKTTAMPPNIRPLPSHLSQSGHLTAGLGGCATSSSLIEFAAASSCWLFSGAAKGVPIAVARLPREWTVKASVVTKKMQTNRNVHREPRINNFILPCIQKSAVLVFQRSKQGNFVGVVLLCCYNCLHQLLKKMDPPSKVRGTYLNHESPRDSRIFRVMIYGEWRK